MPRLISRSKRPARRSAGSSASTRLVAPTSSTLRPAAAALELARSARELNTVQYDYSYEYMRAMEFEPQLKRNTVDAGEKLRHDAPLHLLPGGLASRSDRVDLVDEEHTRRVLLRRSSLD